jgi:hypothetical protein
MKRLLSTVFAAAMFWGCALIVGPSSGQAQDGGIDPNVLIERILSVDAKQRETLKDATFESEYIEGEETDKGFKEKVRFTKKVYVRYLKDTAWYRDEYLEYFKEGQLQSKEDCASAAKEKMEKKKRRKSRDISFNMLEPFTSAKRGQYEITYQGVATDKINDRVCHHFVVRAKEKSDQLINGDYYVDSESFNLVKVDFTPAKLIKSVWFKLSKLDMSIQYASTGDGYWLPSQFSLVGKGKATLFIGVNFGGTEYFRNAVVNSGLSDQLFEADHGK